jgi:hypothetical protein
VKLDGHLISISIMNHYTLSRHFWDFAFENPDKIKPTHISIYFFAMEHCNRLGWKKKFGIPTSMVLEAIGVKSYSVYKKAFDQLAEWELIEVVEYSKNQFSSNIIAFKEYTKANTKADTKALDKALTTHASKQRQSTYQSTYQSIVTVDKQLTINNEQLNKELKELKEKVRELEEDGNPVDAILVLNPEGEEEKKDAPAHAEIWPTFEDFWNLYDRKAGKISVLKKKFDKLPQATKEKIMENLPAYIRSTPDKQFRKLPATYLNNDSWNDEITENKDEKRKEENKTAVLNYLQIGGSSQP